MIINNIFIEEGSSSMEFMELAAKYLQVIRINDLVDMIVVTLLVYFLINLIR